MKKKFPKKFVVINADDLGLCPATNKAILSAYTDGILTSASLLVTCPGFHDAVKRINAHPRLGVGIHLSLTLGKSVLPGKIIPTLADKDGYFYDSFTRLLLKHGKSFTTQVREEFTAQIEKAYAAGVRLDHIDSQAHVHMIPSIFQVILDLAQLYEIPFVRLSKDRVLFTGDIKQDIFAVRNNNLTKLAILNALSPMNEAKIARNRSVITPTFYGVYQTGYMAKSVFQSIFKVAEKGITEILTHPGYSVNDTRFDFKRQRMYDFMASENRKKELAVVLDKELRQEMKRYNIIPVTYRKLASL